MKKMVTLAATVIATLFLVLALAACSSSSQKPTLLSACPWGDTVNLFNPHGGKLPNIGTVRGYCTTSQDPSLTDSYDYTVHFEIVLTDGFTTSDGLQKKTITAGVASGGSDYGDSITITSGGYSTTLNINVNGKTGELTISYS